MKLLAPNHQPGRLSFESFGAIFDADVDLETLCTAFDNMLDTGRDVGEMPACVQACFPLGCIVSQGHDTVAIGLVML